MTRRERQWTALFGLLGVVSSLLLALLPPRSAQGPDWALLGIAAVQLLTACAVVLRVRSYSPDALRQWVWFPAAVAVAALATGTATEAMFNLQPGSGPPQQVWSFSVTLQLLWYPLVALGLRSRFLPRRAVLVHRQRDWVELIDVALLVVAVVVVGWTFVIAPYLSNARVLTAEPSTLVVVWLFGLGDAAMLVMGLWLSITPRAGALRSPEQRLLVAAVLARPVADLALAAAMSWAPLPLLQAGKAAWWLSWLVPALVGVRALQATPSPRTRPAFDRGHISTGRLLALAGAALLAPVLYTTESLHGFPLDDRVAGPMLLVSILLVLGRVMLLVCQLQGSLATIASFERHRGDLRLGALMRHGGDPVILCDAGGTARWISPSLHRVLGLDPERLLGLPVRAFVHPEDEPQAVAALDHLARLSPEDVIVHELRVRHVDGAWRNVEISATNQLAVPEVGAFVLIARDITGRKALEKQLREQALTDALTGLANRVLFTERVEHALALGARASTQPGLLFVDLDDFKTVNDSLGHAAGDRLLVEIAERISSSLRPGDTAARLGGDEFAVLLENLSDPDEAATVADRLLAAFADPVRVADQWVRISASIGIAVADKHTATAQVLLRNADTAMYNAKTTGKGSSASFLPAMHIRAVRRLELKAGLDRALEHGELFLAYQPIVDLATGVPTGAEALMRWRHPLHGLVPPVEFIPLAEETGLIVPFGRWALREACRQMSAWQRSLPSAAAMTVSVNVSGRQLQQGRLVDDVAAALAESGLPAENLLLELTESILLSDRPGSRGDAAQTDVVRCLAELKQLGVRLAVDDFGTGYSALSYLQRFPIDVVKIDKSFTDTLGRSGGARGGNGTASDLVHGVVSLARSLGLHTVAEGVERSDQRDDLQALQCGHAQGHLFARPLAATDFERILRDGYSAAAVAAAATH